MSALIDSNKWRGAIHGMYNFSISEREKYWSYSDDVDFWIACQIKTLIDATQLSNAFRTAFK